MAAEVGESAADDGKLSVRDLCEFAVNLLECDAVVHNSAQILCFVAVGLSFYSYGFPQVGTCIEIGVVQILLVIMFSLYLRKISIMGHRVFLIYAVPLGLSITWAAAFLLTEALFFSNKHSTLIGSLSICIEGCLDSYRVHSFLQYAPSAGDNVLGIVVDARSDNFFVDIKGPTIAFLPVLAFEGGTRRNIPKFEIGTLLYVRVVKADTGMNPELSCMDASGKAAEYGPLKEGFMFETSTGLSRT